GLGADRVTSILLSRGKLAAYVAPKPTTYRNGSSHESATNLRLPAYETGTTGGGASRVPELLRNALIASGAAVFVLLLGSRALTGPVLAVLDQLRARS